MEKCIVYYTDSRLEEGLGNAVRNQILKAAGEIPIVSVSQKPLDFGENFCVGIKPRCYLNLYEQLLLGLLYSKRKDVIYLCEHDVFYHPSHFEFIPPTKDSIYYNENRYYWKRNEEFYLESIGKRALSQAVSYVKPLLGHVKEQVDRRRRNMTSPCVGPFANWESEHPNVDMRHGGNFSAFGDFDKSDKSDKIYKIGYWGTPEDFQEKVNLKDQVVHTPDDVRKHIPGIFLRNDLPELFRLLGFKKGAEVGVKRGEFSVKLCEGIPGLHLKCVDPWLPTPKFGWDETEEFFVTAKKALKPYDVEIIKKTSSHAAAEDVPKWSLDFVYIDADHQFNAVMQDIITWADRVRPGGIVSGHDYDILDVKTAVDTYVKMHGLELFVTDKGRELPESAPSWFFVRPTFSKKEEHRKRRTNRINLMGAAPGWENAPFESGEVWAVNDCHQRRSVDLVIDTHDRQNLTEEHDKVSIEKIKERNIPMLSQCLVEGVPSISKYPIEEIKKEFGTDYFGSGIDYMMALAIYRGATEIHFYGILMSAKSEYAHQKPSVEYWIGIAQGRGIEVVLHDEDTSLLKTRNYLMYGYQTPQGFAKERFPEQAELLDMLKNDTDYRSV